MLNWRFPKILEHIFRISSMYPNTLSLKHPSNIPTAASKMILFLWGSALAPEFILSSVIISFTSWSPFFKSVNLSFFLFHCSHLLIFYSWKIGLAFFETTISLLQTPFLSDFAYLTIFSYCYIFPLAK